LTSLGEAEASSAEEQLAEEYPSPERVPDAGCSPRSRGGQPWPQGTLWPYLENLPSPFPRPSSAPRHSPGRFRKKTSFSDCHALEKKHSRWAIEEFPFREQSRPMSVRGQSRDFFVLDHERRFHSTRVRCPEVRRSSDERPAARTAHADWLPIGASILG
jgi:hypothetical protein